MRKKAIFLDCDGVINNSFSKPKKWEGSYITYYLYEQELVNRVLSIQQKTGADIILSTSWRWAEDSYPTLEEMGIKWIDKTPYVWGRRGYEIQKWLEQHPEYFEYVILDDIEFWMLPSQVPYFIHTNAETGITEEDEEKAIHILNGNFLATELASSCKKQDIECKLTSIRLEDYGWIRGLWVESKGGYFWPYSDYHTYYLDKKEDSYYIHNKGLDWPYQATFISDSMGIFHEEEVKILQIVEHEAD